MDKVDDRELIAEVARDLVAVSAPHELPHFRTLSAKYFARPEAVLSVKKPKDEPLGFGPGDVVPYITPVILAVSASVINFLIQEVKKSLKDESAQVVRETVKRLFKKFRPSTDSKNEREHDLIVLSPGNVTEIRNLALDRARQLNLPEKDAAQLADSLVQSLFAK